ncbi:MAG: hypothetical protein KC591_05560, partial [Gemmatimonadetes bacterium]|nr:hypothetical protein [Gemmatimonadota bacterium]
RSARRFVTKLGLLFHDYEIPDDEDLRYFRRFAPVLRLPLPGFGVFAVLGGVGLLAAVVRRRVPGELGLFLVVYPLSVALFFVFSRYRLPLVAPLACFAGYGVVEAFDRIRARSWRPLAVGAMVAVAIAAVAYRPIHAGTVANSHLSAGIGYEVAGRPEEALAEYRAGLELEPGNPKLLRRAAYLAWDAALATGVERPDPSLVELVLRAARANPEDVSLAGREAAALAATGRLEESARVLESLLERGEEPPGIHQNLALVYEALGRTEDAEREARLAK